MEVEVSIYLCNEAQRKGKLFLLEKHKEKILNKK